MRKRIMIALGINLASLIGATMAYFVFSRYGAVQAESRSIVCTHNLKLLSLPLQRYAEDHDGQFPDLLSQLIPDYFYDTTNTLVCPEAAVQFEQEHGHRQPIPAHAEIDTQSSYRIAPGLTSDAAPDTILVFETAINHHGQRYGVLYVDGRAERIPGIPPKLDTLP